MHQVKSTPGHSSGMMCWNLADQITKKTELIESVTKLSRSRSHRLHKVDIDSYLNCKEKHLCTQNIRRPYGETLAFLFVSY